MYLHLGQGMVVPKADIIGIFDMENCTSSRHTRSFLKLCEDAGEVIDLSTDLPRVFALCASPDGAETVYLSQLSSQTLQKRWERNEIL
ncbi:MAG: DUF370 domain-containing protein [Clostridiales bacterium]|nr:DUF370 domain-containing protein [Clostridiales bacterium]